MLTDKKVKSLFMSTQNFKNYAQFVPLFHYFLTPLCIAILVLASINLYHDVTLLSSMFFLITIALLVGSTVMRSFPLKAQDRAIRAEENLRHFVLTGKLLDKNLTMSQIIALRFADNDEFVDLVQKASANNMSNKDIKQTIQTWRADHDRV